MTKSQRRRSLALCFAVAGSQGQTFDGLLQMLPGVVGKDADNAGGHHGRGHAQYADKRLNLCDFANDLGLQLLLVGDGFVEEELVFFVAGQLSLIGEQAEKTGYELPPKRSARTGIVSIAVIAVPPPYDRADVFGWSCYLILPC